MVSVKNSCEFVNLLDDQEIESGDLPTSFDVESMYTNIPVDDAIQALQFTLGRHVEIFIEHEVKSVARFCVHAVAHMQERPVGPYRRVYSNTKQPARIFVTKDRLVQDTRWIGLMSNAYLAIGTIAWFPPEDGGGCLGAVLVGLCEEVLGAPPCHFDGPLLSFCPSCDEDKKGGRT
ncbi:unnamed protein product [Protopolystoma xenopodis]|uniref:Uncharacterized protein n=1 Tax=Protopolystoma xenopodis TaxID=117903 RepID=A0A448XLZ4_9PLAT|nr:unnamed protein product [Protopolystoma xenopodis]